ncbi:MAG: hypothetical protein ACKOYM_01115, partial [Actinomycetes bacterium]
MADLRGTVNFAQLPDAPRGADQQHFLPAVLLSVVPVALETTRVLGGDWWWLGVAVAGLLAVAVGRSKPSWFPVAVIAAAGALVAWFGFPDGPKIALLVAVGLVLWSCGLGVVTRRSADPSARRVLWPALVPLAAADVLLVLGGSLRWPLVLMAAAAVVAVGCLVWSDPVLRGVESATAPHAPLGRVGRALSRGAAS